MINNISKKLTELITPIVPFDLSEAETGAKPYAVYDITARPYYTKDGVYKIVGTVEIRIVAETLTGADTIRESIESAITSGMRNDEYSASLTGVDKDCLEGVWTITLSYTINQYPAAQEAAAGEME